MGDSLFFWENLYFFSHLVRRPRMVGCQQFFSLDKVQTTELVGNPFSILPDPAALTGVTFPPGGGGVGGGKVFFPPFPKAERRRGEHEMRSDDALSARRPSVGRFAAGKADGRTIERGGGRQIGRRLKVGGERNFINVVFSAFNYSVMRGKDGWVYLFRTEKPRTV